MGYFGYLLTSLSFSTSSALFALPLQANINTAIPPIIIETPQEEHFFDVPFYSQFKDISEEKWKKNACGIADVAMIIEYYKPGIISVNNLLYKGIESGSYDERFGWSHKGLIDLAKKYGLTGEAYSYSNKSMDFAFNNLTTALESGPIIASVHYKLEPTNIIPHLIVVTGTKDDLVYYSDPAENTGGSSISIQKFKDAWKKRYITIRLQQNNNQNK